MPENFNFFGDDVSLNKEIKSFFIKVVVFIIAWQLLYNLVLLPANIPDHFLTKITAHATVFSINDILRVTPTVTVGEFPIQERAIPIMENKRIILYIADGCNALDLMVIYLSIILLLPYYTWRRKMAFSIGGVIVINIANIIRCTLLYWVYRYHNPMFELNHKYIFTILLYLVIFCCWILFTRKGFNREKI
ncbi:exosortase/archaeosortase family protein [Ferruginibacter lapsinanis]|uniref:exosortase/archaeosortase family protein n=1 Tax=Ferruginibacter lapsinanis TaxID=563172 RepID=UPI001E63932D|nr:exosortase/archaeosortase family protein [Ferruginibacter lapsinanis]UEG49900.1 exosortase/archaeosortase family protein [Ferruginibacter lapsinanis]